MIRARTILDYGLGVLAAVAICAPTRHLRCQQLVVRGRVTTDTSSPIAGASISVTAIDGRTWSAHSDSVGDYRVVIDQRDSVYVLRVAMLGFSPALRVIRPTSANQVSTTVDLRLVRSPVTLNPVRTVAARPRPPHDEDGL